MLKFLLISLIISTAIISYVTWADEVRFADCGNGEVRKLSISGCNKRRCRIRRGNMVDVKSSIVANNDSRTATIHMKAFMFGRELDIPIDENACKHIQCPLAKGEVIQFKFSQMIPKSVPRMRSVTIISKLYGETGLLGCIKVKNLRIR